MTDPNKNLDFFDMIEKEINCTVCPNYMGHTVVKKEAAYDDKIVGAFDLFAKSSDVEIICSTCWITKNREAGLLSYRLI
jgi:hypothetical protein